MTDGPSEENRKQDGMEKVSQRPDFLIIGAPKCGTTSLSNALGGHPEIHIPPIKEVGFFHNEEHWQKGVEWYTSHFADAQPNEIIGEATPQYLQSREAPKRIARVCPEAHLVALVRDPVERARSHYWFRRWHGTESRALRDAFEEELSRFPDWNQDDYLLPPSCYVENLERYAEVFDRDHIHVLSLVRLSNSPEAALNEVQRFLGVDIAPLSLETKNSSRAPIIKAWRDFVQYLVKTEGLVKQLIKQVTTRASRRKLKDILHSINMSRKNKPPLPTDLESRLKNVFEERKKRLADEWIKK